MMAAMTPEACVEEAFANLGKSLSVIAGEHNKANVHNRKANKTDDVYPLHGILLRKIMSPFPNQCRLQGGIFVDGYTIFVGYP